MNGLWYYLYKEEAAFWRLKPTFASTETYNCHKSHASCEECQDDCEELLPPSSTK